MNIKHATLASFLMLNVSFFTCAQVTSIESFESFNLSEDSYNNGSTNGGGLTYFETSSGAFFSNNYSLDYGGYWAGGFALSNMADDSTAGYTNMYSAITGVGASDTLTYAVGQGVGSQVTFSSSTIVSGLKITNSTYAALSMKDGDMFAKKFGGASGNDPDWFKLTIFAHGDSVEFYLADYRFADNSKDYIVKSWEFVDLTSLGKVDTLDFKLSSSDNGMFGMNTPAFFCLDHLVLDIPAQIKDIASTPKTSVYPNPARQTLTILSENDINEYTIVDINGKVVERFSTRTSSSEINVSNLLPGIYSLINQTSSNSTSILFSKQ